MSDEWNEQLEYARIQRLPVWERPLPPQQETSEEWRQLVRDTETLTQRWIREARHKGS